jgi:hypothetical protein
MYMKGKKLILSIPLGIIFLILVFGGCDKKSTDSPIEPEEPVFYLMRDYFPLDYGDNWTWEVLGYPVQEYYVDGDSNLGESFTDENQNGIWDKGEEYVDSNYNGEYDSPNDLWSEGVPYVDRNSNGQYDEPNDSWQLGERFLDLDDNGICNRALTRTLYTSILYPNPENHIMTRGGQLLGTYSDGVPGGMYGGEDAFSNDSLGLRWHRHVDKVNDWDYLAQGDPITIAYDTAAIGDTVYSEGYHYSYQLWVSIFEGVEDVEVPAGTFESCLCFKSIALDWPGSMERFNGVSYQWYAKGVGLVKSTGPAKSHYSILKSAIVGGKTYP